MEVAEVCRIVDLGDTTAHPALFVEQTGVDPAAQRCRDANRGEYTTDGEKVRGELTDAEPWLIGEAVVVTVGLQEALVGDTVDCGCWARFTPTAAEVRRDFVLVLSTKVLVSTLPSAVELPLRTSTVSKQVSMSLMLCSA
mmetsp:Transcript_7568/g.18977  ORF Transcript_7568/g.18977 Transcript_7568/m.18977 type:complete len:140 (-) Transcript_7568:437-856(-)